MNRFKHYLLAGAALVSLMSVVALLVPSAVELHPAAPPGAVDVKMEAAFP